MIIEFTENELENISFEFVGARSLSKEYTEERDAFWNAKVEEGRKVGKEFWNGTLYSYEGMRQTDMDNPVIDLGEMKYSDRIFKKKYGYGDMVDRFGEEHWQTHCIVSSSMVTTDGLYAVGVKNRTTNLVGGLYSHVSGNLNKDELIVKGFSNIYDAIAHEIEEEANVQVDTTKLSFNRSFLYKGCFTFDFVYELDISSQDIELLDNDDVEMKKFIAMSTDEIIVLPNGSGIPDFEYSKRYLGKR